MVNCYYEEVFNFMGEEDAPDPDYFLECYGRMAINSFHVLDENQVSLLTQKAYKYKTLQTIISVF
jgi:hypothetical protein